MAVSFRIQGRHRAGYAIEPSVVASVAGFGSGYQRMRDWCVGDLGEGSLAAAPPLGVTTGSARSRPMIVLTPGRSSSSGASDSTIAVCSRRDWCPAFQRPPGLVRRHDRFGPCRCSIEGLLAAPGSDGDLVGASAWRARRRRRLKHAAASPVGGPCRGRIRRRRCPRPQPAPHLGHRRWDERSSHGHDIASGGGREGVVVGQEGRRSQHPPGSR